jgi:hypothetical protein
VPASKHERRQAPAFVKSASPEHLRASPNAHVAHVLSCSSMYAVGSSVQGVHVAAAGGGGGARAAVWPSGRQDGLQPWGAVSLSSQGR